MKAKRKALLLSLCAILLVAASVLGTMAYLKDSKTVVNTFSVGNVKITLDETKVTPDGKPVTGTGAGRFEAGNTYHLIPGVEFTKDPQVHIDAESEPCYVRMLVTVSMADKLSALYDDKWTPDMWNIELGEGWEYYADGFVVDDLAKTATYEIRCNTMQTPDGENKIDMPKLFTTFTVDENLTGEQVATLNGMNITVTAEAIQAASFNNAAAAFAALNAAK